MTPLPELHGMLWVVADWFGFGSSELFNMPVSRLQFWYEGAKKLTEAERNAAKSGDS